MRINRYVFRLKVFSVLPPKLVAPSQVSLSIGKFFEIHNAYLASRL